MTIASAPTPGFEDNDDASGRGARGQLAHRDAVAHGALLQYRLWQPCAGVWSLVGNGLSNQSFVQGPDGLIAIDTGESIEEMAAALVELRKHTQAPVVAVIYTHFHYVAGTKAVLAEGVAPDLPIWGHARIVGNRLRVANEIGAAYSRGLVQQFGMMLPPEGADAMLHCGIGIAYRNPGHAPFTGGFMPPTHSIERATATTIAGLRVEFTPAPSDCDDSITLWFPDLGVCINNLVWPALFNVFAIRGEEYRDPRVLLNGLDHILSLQADYLLGAHGPPVSGREAIRASVTDYRDAIQFLWDQTVRGINRGLTLGELCEAVRLPACYARSYFTREFYGVAEHHVRQIHNGLRGWFDGDEAMLFPLPPAERARRLVAGFGGATQVRTQAEAALQANDLRWALELATWLLRAQATEQPLSEAGSPADRQLLASILRRIGQRSSAANIRNWCLTRARELEGLLDLRRLRRHRFTVADVLANPPATFVHALRVILLPDAAAGVDDTLAWHFADGTKASLHIRHHVAVPGDGQSADLAVAMELATWARILGGKQTLRAALADGSVVAHGDMERILRILRCFDLPALAL